MLFVYFLLILAFMASLAFPPLLLITIPAIIGYFYVAHKAGKAFRAQKQAIHDHAVRERRDKVLRSF